MAESLLERETPETSQAPPESNLRWLTWREISTRHCPGLLSNRNTFVNQTEQNQRGGAGGGQWNPVCTAGDSGVVVEIEKTTHATHLHRQPAPSVGVAEQLAAESSIPKLSRPQMQIYTDAFITVLQLRFINTHPFHPRPPFTVHRRGPAFPVAPQVEDPVSRTVLPVHLYLSRGRGNGGGAPRSAECRRIKSFFVVHLFCGYSNAETESRFVFGSRRTTNKTFKTRRPGEPASLASITSVTQKKSLRRRRAVRLILWEYWFPGMWTRWYWASRRLSLTALLCVLSPAISLSLHTSSFDFYSKYNDNTNMCDAILFK